MMTLVDYGANRLGMLCQGAGFGAETDKVVETFRRLLTPWGEIPVGRSTGWVSDIGDDHSPIEFSVAIVDGQPEVRVLMEAQAKEPTLAAYRAAGIAFNERLEAELGVDLGRLRQVQDIFLPADMRGAFALWNAVCFSPGQAPMFKAYLNPQARGIELAHALTEKALVRLGFDRAFGALGCKGARRGPQLDEIKYFALDLNASSEARVKVYVHHHRATAEHLEVACSAARDYVPGEARDFVHAMTDGARLLASRSTNVRPGWRSTSLSAPMPATTASSGIACSAICGHATSTRRSTPESSKTSPTGASMQVSACRAGSRCATPRREACVATSAEATLVKKPVDITFIVDNSGSMGNNIESVQNNINANFASIIGASGIDYRVIMISEHGSLGSESICVGAPLSTTTCMPVPGEPGVNPPIFFQYSIPIGSHNSICQALASYDGTLPDQYGLGVGGWSQWLRKEAFKVFVEVTDDGVTCTHGGVTYDDDDNAAAGQTAAQNMDAAILALDPEQFGTAEGRNYIWHSIVGLAENMPATAAYAPGDALVTGVCDTAIASGTGYQVLSQTTGGLRFPICEFMSFDVVFQEIAKGVIEGAKVECEFPVPEPPAGETLDLATVVVAYTPGDGSATQKFKQVSSADKCEPASFYIEGDLIKLCPDACAAVQADDTAKLEILFGCEPDIQ